MDPFERACWKIDTRPLSDAELQTAYERWLLNFPHSKADQNLRGFLEIDSQVMNLDDDRPTRLRDARVALLYSLQSAGDQIKVSKYQFRKFEDAESKGTITINSLKKAAEALDCELVYAIRPKAKKNYSRVVWEKLAQPNLNQKSLFKQVARYRPNLLNWFVARQINDQEFREKMGWSKRLRD